MNKIYFVDCFDTIIYRNKQPSTIFKEWAEQLGKDFAVDPDFIYKKYNSLNVKLSIKKIFTKGVLEEHFDIVLEKLYDKIPDKKNINKEQFVQTARELYVQKEALSHYVKKEFINFLRNQKAAGSTLYIVSDFYCNSAIMKTWLKNQNILDIFEDVFVSSDFDKEKATGKIYNYLIKKLKLNKKNITMIGDNIWSDLFIARTKGITAMNVKKLTNEKILTPQWDEIFFKYQNKFNLSNHAFPLYLFTKRLYENLEKNKTKDIIFMSREGQFLKTLFELYCQYRKNIGLDVIDIKTHYFYGSRNSVMAASLKPLEQEGFELLFRFFICMSVNAFLHSIGFSKEQIEQVGKNISINMKKTHLIFYKSGAYKKLRQNKTFCEIYEKNRVEQSQAFGKYMKSFGINYEQDGLCFVDIGYHGTMQDLILKFYDEKVNILGYFVKTRVSKKEMETKIGLISDKANKALFGNKINSYDAYNYEQILRADHGRCLGYKSEGEKVVPDIDLYLDDAEVYENYVKEMQAQITDKFNMIMKLALLPEWKEKIEEICVMYYYYTIKYKSSEDYDWIIDMQDTSHDDFGIVGYFGRAFGKGFRKVVFGIKDRLFVSRNKALIKRLKKNISL